jgi:hypothetical protein
MKIHQIRKQVFFSIMFFLSVGTVCASAQQNAPAPASAPYAGATVADFEKKVQLQLPGQGSSAPTRGQVLPPDTVINTGDGHVLLHLEDGSDILVQPHTSLILTQPSATNWQRLQLLLGQIKAEIQKRISGAPPFQIGTPSAVISVRGTRFYVEVDKSKTTQVDVEEGEVQLENAKGIGAPVSIKAGSSSRVGANSAPEPAQPTSEMHQQSGKSGSQGNEGSGGNGQGKGLGQGNQSHGQPHTPPSIPKGGGHKWTGASD